MRRFGSTLRSMRVATSTQELAAHSKLTQTWPVSDDLAFRKSTSINTGWRRLQPGATAYRGLGRAGRSVTQRTPRRPRLQAFKQGRDYIKRENTVRTAPGSSDEALPASRAPARPAHPPPAATPLQRRARTTPAATTTVVEAAWRRPATPPPRPRPSTWLPVSPPNSRNRRAPTPRGGPRLWERVATDWAPGTSGSFHKNFRP